MRTLRELAGPYAAMGLRDVQTRLDVLCAPVCEQDRDFTAAERTPWAQLHAARLLNLGVTEVPPWLAREGSGIPVAALVARPLVAELRAKLLADMRAEESEAWEPVPGVSGCSPVSPRAFQRAKALSPRDVYEGLARHEALGHAVVGAATGADIVAVGLEVRGDRIVNGYTLTRGTTSAAFAVAGAVAARLAGYGHVEEGRMSPGDRAQMHKALAASGRQNVEGIRRAEREAERLIRANWKPGQVLVGALLASGHLEGAELARLLEPIRRQARAA